MPRSQRIAGQRIAGQRIAGQRIAGQRIAGQRIAGQRIAGLVLAGLRFAGNASGQALGSGRSRAGVVERGRDAPSPFGEKPVPSADRRHASTRRKAPRRT